MGRVSLGTAQRWCRQAPRVNQALSCTSSSISSTFQGGVSVSKAWGHFGEWTQGSGWLQSVNETPKLLEGESCVSIRGYVERGVSGQLGYKLGLWEIRI